MTSYRNFSISHSLYDQLSCGFHDVLADQFDDPTQVAIVGRVDDPLDQALVPLSRALLDHLWDTILNRPDLHSPLRSTQ